MKLILFFCTLFGGCVVAGLLTSFFDSSSLDKQVLFWWLTWNINYLGNIKQSWVPGGWGGVGLLWVKFWPNILSLLVLIQMRIRIKTRLWMSLVAAQSSLRLGWQGTQLEHLPLPPTTTTTSSSYVNAKDFKPSQKKKVHSIYKETSKQFSGQTLAPKSDNLGQKKKSQKWIQSRSQ